MVWHYASPGSPWQNGVSEALIRSLKRTLPTIVSPTTQLEIQELQTALYEVAELLNERPIGLGHQGASGHDFDSEANTYLCPNQLLLGRSSVSVPSGQLRNDNVSHADRFVAIQTIVTEWWSRWSSQYLPTLVYQTKWFYKGREPKLGDIVFIKDLNPIRGNWNIGEIIEIPENTNVSPLNVKIRYKTSSTNNYESLRNKTQWRNVRNLSLIVAAEERSELNPEAPQYGT